MGTRSMPGAEQGHEMAGTCFQHAGMGTAMSASVYECGRFTSHSIVGERISDFAPVQNRSWRTARYRG